MKIKHLHFISLSLMLSAAANSQDTTKVAPMTTELTLEEMEEMSLEQLMNVSIVSASREKESSLDAPLSSYAITRQEIEKAGSTSIPEALRLCPALIVSEITNGNYHVDIRGFNNVPAFEYSITNKFMLVMIDNRPIFNQLQGGTFWLNLPVDINDVERIEVIAGPSSSLYGPNAVAGVINIITRRPETNGILAYTNSQMDFSTMSPLTNLSVGYKKDKFSAMFTGNYSYRQRFETDLYNTVTERYMSFEEYPDIAGSTFSKRVLFTDPKIATRRVGGNIYLDYKLNEKTKFDVSGGINNSEGLGSIGIGTGSTMGYWPSTSTYQRLRADVYGFSIQASNVMGNQSFLKGVQPYQYDFRTSDLYLDYTYKYENIFSLRPAVSYQNALVDDTPYRSSLIPGIFNNKATMYNLAGSLKLEVTPLKFIRFIAAGRADMFKLPESKLFLSYELILNIKPTANHNIRLIYSKSYAGSYIMPTHIDFANGNQVFSPNKELNPANMQMVEIGYRGKASKTFYYDVALFYQLLADVSQFLASPLLIGTTFGINLKTENLKMQAIQMGATFSLNMVVFNNKLQFKPFVTIQKTDWKDFSPYLLKPFYVSPTINDGGLSSQSYRDISATNTPPVYTGFFLNYLPISKLNINLNGYYFDVYNLYGLNEQPSNTPNDPNFNPNANFIPSAASNIASKVLLNARISYEVVENIKIYGNVRNLLGSKSREYYGSDQIGSLYTLGVLVDLKK